MVLQLHVQRVELVHFHESQSHFSDSSVLHKIQVRSLSSQVHFQELHMIVSFVSQSRLIIEFQLHTQLFQSKLKISSSVQDKLIMLSNSYASLIADDEAAMLESSTVTESVMADPVSQRALISQDTSRLALGDFVQIQIFQSLSSIIQSVSFHQTVINVLKSQFQSEPMYILFDDPSHLYIVIQWSLSAIFGVSTKRPEVSYHQSHTLAQV